MTEKAMIYNMLLSRARSSCASTLLLCSLFFVLLESASLHVWLRHATLHAALSDSKHR